MAVLTSGSTNNGTPRPMAFIAINKNRVKHYNEKRECNTIWNENYSKVYLSGGTEFQIELFNPTGDSYLAKLIFNGKSEYHSIYENGIVIRPGERIYLDRYLNENRKFLFDVYDVENNNSQVDEAIKNNGVLEVLFYKEKAVYKPLNQWGNSIWGTYYEDKYPNTWQSPNTNFNTPKGIYKSSIICPLNTDSSITYTYNYSAVNSVDILATSSATKETGRIEKGGESEQKFDTCSKEFEYMLSYKAIFNLLPVSQKPLSKKDIAKTRKYCSNCGKKVRPNDRYCSSCGNKL